MKYPKQLNVPAWEEWLDFRKKQKMKAYKTDRPIKALLKITLDLDEQREIIEQSMNNCWQGLFPVKKVRAETRKERNIQEAKRALCLVATNPLLKHS